MEASCRNCRHFDKKDGIFGLNTRGLCVRFKEDKEGKRKKISYLRWVTDSCAEFRPKEKEEEKFQDSNQKLAYDVNLGENDE